jgi:hypothetical protein
MKVKMNKKGGDVIDNRSDCQKAEDGMFGLNARSDFHGYMKNMAKSCNYKVEDALQKVETEVGARYGVDEEFFRNKVGEVRVAEQEEEEEEERQKENLDWAKEYKRQALEKGSDLSVATTEVATKRPNTLSEAERQAKLAKSRAAFADISKPKVEKKRTMLGRMKGFFKGGNKTKKGKSMCIKKTAKKCVRVRGCKVATGKKRTYCRKKRNHTVKRKD